MYTTETLFIAIENNDQDAIQAHLKQHGIDAPDNFGRTALLNAAFSGNLAVVTWLIANGANLSHQDKNGYTALHFAAQEGHTETVALLLKNGANKDTQDKHGNTPSWVALLNWGGGKNFNALKTLVEHKANLTLKNNAGRCTLDLIPEKLKFDLGIE